ncbi:hypothetical protein [Streptomyces sp. bgisy095]|uniref:hypothetical protein n=1 Tax=unclassified Streptomyces TaxID=2593676 RepID=UPI003D737DC5
MSVIPEQVPAEPVYTVTLTATGAYIDGTPVPEASGDPEQSRRAALSEIYVKAALHGRPVRFVAKEADGTTWPMIMDTGGGVITLHTPHPTPARPPAPSAPVPTPAPVPAPAPAPPTPEARDWTAPLPAAVAPLYAELRTAESTGDLPQAVTLAAKLEDDLSAQYGPLHPYTVNVLSLRASLVLRQGGDWYETTELLVHTAIRRRDAHAQPVQDTLTTARNAHAAWRSLIKEDAEGAAELAGAVAEMLEQFGETERTRDVLTWAEAYTHRR